jgi:uracil-DNA glycosylase family 4
MAVSGQGRERILLLDSAPHEEEDRDGIHLTGGRAAALDKVIDSCGYVLETDFWRMSAVGCRLPKDKHPGEEHICACRSYVLQTIAKLKPRMIICLGEVAAATITGHSFAPLKRGIDVVRGFVVPDQTIGTRVAFTYGVDYLTKTSFDPVIRILWKADIESFLEQAGDPFPVYSHKGCIETITDPSRACVFLERVLERRPMIAFDYETTGLKPHAPGHRILSAAVAVSAKKSVAFPIDNPSVLELWKAVLVSEHITKVCHNATFEILWSDVHAAPVRGMVWDTCVLAHIDDCRRGVTALDTQAYLRFGVPPWDTVEQMKQSTDKSKGANSPNRLADVPLYELLEYNAIDALYTWWLADYYRKMNVLTC